MEKTCSAFTGMNPNIVLPVFSGLQNFDLFKEKIVSLYFVSSSSAIAQQTADNMISNRYIGLDFCGLNRKPSNI